MSSAGPDSEDSPLDGLLDLLSLEQLEENLYRGRSPAISPPRVFGGQVAAQSLVAAGRTVDPDRHVHSLHSYFLRGGDPSIPIVYQVDRARDGRSFTTRRVVAIQHGRPIFTMSCSFQALEEGVRHHTPMPRVTPPEDLPTLRELLAGRDDIELIRTVLPMAFDVRYVERPAWLMTSADAVEVDEARVWFKPVARLPDDPLVHVCLMAYLSDLTMVDTILARHAIGGGVTVRQVASLDHAMWFHRPVRMDDWVLYDTRSPAAAGNRGLATGSFYSADGVLLATVVQEALVRVGAPG